MNNLTLVKPKLDYCESYQGLVSEFVQSQEDLIPFPLRYPSDDYQMLLEKLDNESRGIGLSEGFVANTTFWLIKNNQEVVGVSNLRHELTDRLRVEGGHIGYGIRPSKRRKGLGVEILKQTLLEAKKINLSEVIITCNKDNVGSATIIKRNGGELREEGYVESYGGVVQRYWISI